MVGDFEPFYDSPEEKRDALEDAELDAIYSEDDESDRLERKWMDEIRTAQSCICGAYQIDKNGNIILVADCCCGADASAVLSAEEIEMKIKDR